VVYSCRLKDVKDELWASLRCTSFCYIEFIEVITKVVVAGQTSNSTIMFYDSVTGRWIHNIEMQKYAEMLLHFF